MDARDLLEEILALHAVAFRALAERDSAGSPTGACHPGESVRGGRDEANERAGGGGSADAGGP